MRIRFADHERTSHKTGEVARLPPSKANKRRNEVFRRQDEWFFVPSNRDIPEATVLRNEPLQRTARSKPNVCQALFLEGGELVHLVGNEVLTEVEHKSKKERKPDFDRFGHRTTFRNPAVFVRRYVHHEDHATVNPEGWHQVFLNGESTANNVNITFFDQPRHTPTTRKHRWIVFQRLNKGGRPQ